ncbi:HU family DNA-binding protein [Priestia aryabhattai]|uniref:HU family DNA-binding protein n=1 Tax=Priestia aryabhattai TaxID=412384 RepID=UPI003D2932B5
MNNMKLITATPIKVNPTKKNSTKAVNIVFRTIAVEHTQEEKIQLIGFGIFEIRKCTKRTSRIFNRLIQR